MRPLRSNARSALTEIGEILKLALSDPWLCNVHLHLLGFSAGGIVAINAGEEFDLCTLQRPGAATWCDKEMPATVDVEVDVVTIATPFALFESEHVLALLAQGFAWIGQFVIPPLAGAVSWLLDALGFRGGARVVSQGHRFWASLGVNDYGGKPAKCVCRLVSMMSSGVVGGSDKKGDGAAGGREPGKDSRMKDWRPQVIDLQKAGVSDHTHDKLLLTILKKDTLRPYLMPGCQCVAEVKTDWRPNRSN